MLALPKGHLGLFKKKVQEFILWGSTKKGLANRGQLLEAEKSCLRWPALTQHLAPIRFKYVAMQYIASNLGCFKSLWDVFLGFLHNFCMQHFWILRKRLDFRVLRNCSFYLFMCMCIKKLKNWPKQAYKTVGFLGISSVYSFSVLPIAHPVFPFKAFCRKMIVFKSFLNQLIFKSRFSKTR